MGGFLYAVTGPADRPPMGTALQQMELTAGRNGVIAIMAALLRREQTGEGGHIDVSDDGGGDRDAVDAHPELQLPRTQPAAGRRGQEFVMDGMHLPTKDGEVTLTTAGTGGKPMQVWAEFLGEPRLLDPKFATRAVPQRQLGGAARSGRAEAHAVEQPRPDARDHGARPRHRARAESRAGGEFTAPRRARLTSSSSTIPEAGTLKYPGPGFFFDGANPMQTTRAAPRLGEHNAEIYCGRLGLSNEELGRLRAARVV